MLEQNGKTDNAGKNFIVVYEVVSNRKCQKCNERVPRSSIAVVRLRMYTKCIVFTRSGTEKLDLKTHIKIRGRYICCSWCQDGATLLSHSIDRHS